MTRDDREMERVLIGAFFAVLVSGAIYEVAAAGGWPQPVKLLAQLSWIAGAALILVAGATLVVRRITR